MNEVFAISPGCEQPESRVVFTRISRRLEQTHSVFLPSSLFRACSVPLLLHPLYQGEAWVPLGPASASPTPANAPLKYTTPTLNDAVSFHRGGWWRCTSRMAVVV